MVRSSSTLFLHPASVISFVFYEYHSHLFIFRSSPILISDLIPEFGCGCYFKEEVGYNFHLFDAAGTN